MRTESIRGKTVKFFESIDEMPIKNYYLLNEYALKENEIGGDLGSVNKRFEKLDIFLSQKKIDEAIQERKNLQQTFWNIFKHNNFNSFQFGCFIASIDGHDVSDLSETNLKMVTDELNLSIGYINGMIEELKKKLIPN